MGFSQALQTIATASNPQRQTLLFSATLQQYGIIKIAEKVLRDPEMVRLNSLYDQHENLEQQVIIADNTAHKQNLLAWLLLNETFNKALVFTNSRAQADSLSGVLQGKRVRCGVLHGEMDQKERNRIMALFRQGTINTLIATDLAARGWILKAWNWSSISICHALGYITSTASGVPGAAIPAALPWLWCKSANGI